MAYKHYNRQLVLYLFVVVVLAMVLGTLIFNRYSWPAVMGVFLAELFAVISFVHFLNTTNRKIDYFIQAIKNDDTTLRFPLKSGNAIINDLHKSLNELNVILQQTKVKSQIRERYFSEILQNIATGVMVVTEKGFITDVNISTLELFGLQTLTHLTQLDRVDPKFRQQLSDAGSRRKKLLVLNRGNEKIQVITLCSVISLKDEDVKLITLQDIRGELERKEIDSWVKLIRVLSHEIMNSLAPVTSIAQSLKGIWKEKILADTCIAADSDIESTIGGLDVIADRGEALIRFVQSYRVLTHVPQPKLMEVSIHSLLDSLNILVSPFKEGVEFSIKFHYPETDFVIVTDEQMLIQVILNLVKNSVEAIKNKADGKVDINIKQIENNRIQIEVIDNGQGIPEKLIDEIFVPFFTTKVNGTGVGLSYSRQIIKALGGIIKCTSNNDKTVFTIQL